ncbi:hypothetical protein [Nisaea sp.]|uniref:hypothetical protein n=1 Tax=Nisaea sp. TaxID=2024842 RepID=UPI0032998984
MTQPKLPEDDDGFAKALFVASSADRDINLWLSEAAEAEDKPVPFAAFVQCLADPDSATGLRVMELAARRSDVRTTLMALARRFALGHLPAVAAASDGSLAVRETDAFRMRLEAAYGAGGLAYFIVERLDDESDMPRIAIGMPEAGEPVMRSLPESADGGVQLMLPSDDPFLHVFRDPDSRFLLA